MADPYLGEIRMFAGNFAPVGWMFCQGQTLAIADYEALYALIGTTYGGDGQSTFALPNLASRIPLHKSPEYPLAAAGGAEQVTLTRDQLPVHTHTAAASDATGTATSPAGNVWAAGSTTEYSSGAPSTTMSPAALAAAGGNQPHENMPPYVGINFIIALNGIYPPQD